VGSRALAASSACTSCSSTRFTLTRPEGPAASAKLSSHMATRCSNASMHAFSENVCLYTGSTHTWAPHAHSPGRMGSGCTGERHSRRNFCDIGLCSHPKLAEPCPVPQNANHQP
jgi:hypothetical protein